MTASASRLRGGSRLWSGFLPRDALAAFGFLLPYLVAFAAFRVYPIFSGLYISLFRRDILGVDNEFIGLGNYARLLADPFFRQAVTNTAWFTALTAPTLVVLSLGLAIALKGPSRLVVWMRGIFFAPRLLSVAVVSLLWLWILEPQWGLLNSYLLRLGLPRQTWLADVQWAMVAIAVAYVWWWLGFNMIILLAGLQQIPSDLYEAASLDGAGPWASFRSVTVPGLRRPLIFISVTQFISSFQMFALVYIMTGGGPFGTTRVLVQYIYESGFRHFAMGYASAMAYVLFVVVFVVTVFQLRLMRAWED